jgi:hypothetical protein
MNHGTRILSRTPSLLQLQPNITKRKVRMSAGKSDLAKAMSSGFVSGGTADDPIKRSDEWLAAQKELEENRARRAAEAQRPGERSLYEILEANKGKHTAYMTRYGLVLGLIT